MPAFGGDAYANAIGAHFDADSAWLKVQRSYLSCPASQGPRFTFFGNTSGENEGRTQPSCRVPFAVDMMNAEAVVRSFGNIHESLHPMRASHLAQINVGRLVAPHGDPRVAPFFDALERINSLAEESPGFVWRLQSDAGNATDIQTTPDPLFIVNMSVWLNAESLFEFVYRSAHTPEMSRRREYFERFAGAYQALWWVPAGHVPSVDEGLSRLWRLDRYGPTVQAFTFKMRFPAPGLPGVPKDMEPDPWCMARA